MIVTESSERPRAQPSQILQPSTSVKALHENRRSKLPSIENKNSDSEDIDQQQQQQQKYSMKAIEKAAKRAAQYSMIQQPVDKDSSYNDRSVGSYGQR